MYPMRKKLLDLQFGKSRPNCAVDLQFGFMKDTWAKISQEFHVYVYVYTVCQ